MRLRKAQDLRISLVPHFLWKKKDTQGSSAPTGSPKNGQGPGISMLSPCLITEVPEVQKDNMFFPNKVELPIVIHIFY